MTGLLTKFNYSILSIYTILNTSIQKIKAYYAYHSLIKVWMGRAGYLGMGYQWLAGLVSRVSMKREK